MRNINEIAREIRADWKNVSPYAFPYLKAMERLSSVDDGYGSDKADSIIRYFLSNATVWRGDAARRIKKELNDMLK